MPLTKTKDDCVIESKDTNIFGNPIIEVGEGIEFSEGEANLIESGSITHSGDPFDDNIHMPAQTAIANECMEDTLDEKPVPFLMCDKPEAEDRDPAYDLSNMKQRMPLAWAEYNRLKAVNEEDKANKE